MKRFMLRRRDDTVRNVVAEVVELRAANHVRRFDVHRYVITSTLRSYQNRPRCAAAAPKKEVPYAQHTPPRSSSAVLCCAALFSTRSFFHYDDLEGWYGVESSGTAVRRMGYDTVIRWYEKYLDSPTSLCYTGVGTVGTAQWRR
jgi:hypothetical protein